MISSHAHLRRRIVAFVLLTSWVLTPRSQAATPKVADGFSIRLVAQVPAVRSPCQVATAPDGSLFVAEDPMDQEGPYESRKGRILRFREGEEPVVFAEDFRAIFGMAWRDGALYVSHMPFLSVLKDTDNDGKVDSRVELFADLGIVNNAGLNDHIVSGLRFGIDGRLYISVGDKGVYGATGPDGIKVQLKGGGVLRCNPDGTKLEIVSSGTRNHLEANLDARDTIFTYDNTDDGDGWWTRVTHHVDGAYFGYPYDYHDRTDRMLPRIAEYGGGSPCGAIFYGEDAWPEKYRGRLIWSEWGKRAVRAFSFTPKGASYEVGDIIELAEAGEATDFRPLDLALSYDGKTVYVADWGMGGWGSKVEKVGKIYAITYDGPSNPAPRGKDSDSADDQIKALSHASFNERLRGQAALIKMAKVDGRILPTLVRLLADPATDSTAARHLLWAIDAIAGGTPEASVPLIAALKSPTSDVRAQAARALGMRSVAIAEEPLRALLGDTDVTVRLQAIIALGRIGSKAAVPYLLPILADADLYLAFSAKQALRRIGSWEPVAVGLDSTDRAVRLGVLSTLELVYDSEAASLLAKYAANPQRADDERAKALFYLAQTARQTAPWDGKWWGTRPSRGKPPGKTVAWAGTPIAETAVRTALVDPTSPLRLAAVSAIREMGERQSLPTLRTRFTSEPDMSVRLAIAETLGVMKDADSVGLLSTTLKDAKTPTTLGDAVVKSLEMIGGPDSAKALVELLDAPTLDENRLTQLIGCLGRLKSKEAAGLLVARLGSESPKTRAACADALGQIGQSEGVIEPLRALLKDKDLDVLKAAITALVALKDRDSVPALIALSEVDSTRFDASRALASMPDARAIRVYVRALGDKSPELRVAASKALGSFKEVAAPLLDQLATRNELPSVALPELRKVFSTLAPIKDWQIVGPFPINERQPFNANRPIDLTVTIPGPDGKELAWTPTTAIDDDGQVDLTKIYHGNIDNKSVFGYGEIESPDDRAVAMAVGSDDTLQVWLNGKEIHKISGSRGFSPEQARYDVRLKKGTNRVMLKCGNNSGPWAFAVAYTFPAEYAFLKGPAPGAFDADAYRNVATKGQGNAERGRAIFADLKGLACVKCHVVAGQGGAVGPDLTGIAARYPREELITSILFPSAKISSGYEPVIIATTSGQTLTGILKAETPEGIEIEDADAKRIKIGIGDIEERRKADVSLMPTGLAAGISTGDFADLIAYLETLKEPAPAKPSEGR